MSKPETPVEWLEEEGFRYRRGSLYTARFMAEVINDHPGTAAECSACRGDGWGWGYQWSPGDPPSL